MKPYMLFAVFGAVTLNAAAQHASPSRPDDPSVAVPVVVYASPLKGYVRYREEAPRPWRVLNEEVARTGGHAGIVGGMKDVHGKRLERPVGPASDASTPVDPKRLDRRSTNPPKPEGHRQQGH